MGLLEDIPELYMIIPVVVGVGCVAITVFLIFWLGLGKQRTFEEAKAIASRQADLVLQEEYKNSPRAKKGKKSFPRKKKWEDPQQEESAESLTRKGILKVGTTSVKEPTPERSPRNRVGFNIDGSTEESKPTRINPPTPHPHKTAPPVFKVKEESRTPQPLFEEEEEEESSPPSKPPAQVSRPPTIETAKKSSSDSPRSGSGQKRKPKAKKESGEAAGASDEGMSASRIVDVVGASSLSDEDIQQLVSVLLEKMNTNSEWEAANLRSESVKSLKKQNQELQRRSEEAEKTVNSHYAKIKELRTEIQNEKLKLQATDAKLQSKSTAHSNEMAIVKTRLAGVEEENKQLKALSTSVTVQKLEDENKQLRAQIRQVSGQSQTLSSQVKDMSEENASLKAELHRAKEAIKSGTQPRGGDRVVELESLLGNMEEEKQQLQSEMMMIHDENSRLKGEAASLKTELGELEQLKMRNDKLEATNGSLSDDKAGLLQEIERLKKTDEIVEQQADPGDALRAEYEGKMAQEVASVRGELTNQVEGLEGRITELEGRCVAKEREVEDLTSQIEKCSSLQNELKALSVQLTGEQASKKELEQELESLKCSETNGPSTNQPDSANEEELTHLRQEKEELRDTVKQLERKLDEVKSKNNTLRDSMWKVKDEVAEEKKIMETKLREAHQKTETLCKAAKKETRLEAQDAHRLFLTQLFPTVTVDEEEFTKWLDQFECKVQAILSENDEKVKALQAKVADLRENEQKSVQETEKFRVTLQNTMNILERLQSEVQNDNAEHQKTLQEKEEMIERERSTNRTLQDELRKEQEVSSSLRTDLQAAGQSGTRLSEVEEQLHEEVHQHELSQKEADSLRHSLKNELEVKNKVQRELEELQEKQAEIVKRLSASEEEKELLQKQLTTVQDEVEQLKTQLQTAVAQVAAAAERAKTPPSPAVHTEV